MNLFQSDNTGSAGMYSAFPLFYSHVLHFSSGSWPLFNTALEYYMYGRYNTDMIRNMFSGQGLSDQDKANIALQGRPLSEMVGDTDNLQEQVVTIAKRLLRKGGAEVGVHV